MSITSANAVALLSTSIFPISMQLQQWAADDAWSVESTQLAEAVMGVDGKASYGYTPTLKTITFNFLADSISLLEVVDPIILYMDTNKEILPLSLTLSLPALGRGWQFENGTLTNAQRAPDGKSTLQSRTAVLTFESVTPVLLV